MEGSTLTDRTAVKAALVGKDYIETIDWTVEELEEVVAVSMELKADRKAGRRHKLLDEGVTASHPPRVRGQRIPDAISSRLIQQDSEQCTAVEVQRQSPRSSSRSS